MITAEHGRWRNSALFRKPDLLANIVITWNTHRLLLAVDQVPGEDPDELLKGIGPVPRARVSGAQARNGL